MNTSATGGYLTPDPDVPQPLEGDELADFFQAIIVGCTGLDGQYVRPRWQPEPPNLPPANQDWIAFGIVIKPSDELAHIRHDSTGDGADVLQRQQIIEMLCSAYGPRADSYIELLRDGLQIAQNREALQLAGMGLIRTGDAINAPMLVKDLWQNRIDMRVVMTRQVIRRYPVLNILSEQGTIRSNGDSIATIDTPINVEE